MQFEEITYTRRVSFGTLVFVFSEQTLMILAFNLVVPIGHAHQTADTLHLETRIASKRTYGGQHKLQKVMKRSMIRILGR